MATQNKTNMVMLVDILEYSGKDGSQVIFGLCDAYGKMWYFRGKASLIEREKSASLPAIGYVRGEVVSRYGDVVCFRTRRSDGITSMEGNDVFYLLDSQLKE